MNNGKEIKFNGHDYKLSEAVEAPDVKSPVKDSKVNNPVEFSGEGEPGWIVHIFSVPTDGISIASQLVGGDKKWSTEVTLPVKKYSVFAVQMNNRERSPMSDTFEFEVIG